MRSNIVVIVCASLLAACGSERHPSLADSGAGDAGSGMDSGVVCAPSGSIGDGRPCACPDECTAGAICQSESVGGDPGGNCVRACAAPTECSADGTTCSSGRCYVSCTTGGDCPNGRLCNSNGICVSLCGRDADCTEGTCDPYQALCIPAWPGAGVLEPCAAHDDCRSRFCGTAGTAFQGVCMVRCSIAAQTCPDGALCFSTEAGSETGFCAPRCGVGDACPRDLVCLNVPVPAGEAACFPRSAAM